MGNASSKDEVTLGPEIGRGTYAVVHQAVWNHTKVAAKKIHPYIFNKPEAKKYTVYTEEWKILSVLDHPNIVKYLTVVLPEKPPKSPDESTIIITELLDQDLKTFIKRAPAPASTSKTKPKVSFRDTVNIMLDVAKGLEYLHELQRPIVHRNLSCENILLTSTKQAKIAGFAFAKYFPGGKMAASPNPGTLMSRAPETFGKYFFSREPITYGTEADVFSFGVVMLEVIVGHPSVRISELRSEDGKIIPEHYRRNDDLLEIDLEHPLRELVLHCLEDDPKDRPTALDLVNELSNYNNSNDFQRLQDSLNCKQVIHRMPADKYDYELKIVLVGDTAVGKTSIATKFVQPDLPFQENRPMTCRIKDEYNARFQFKGKSVLLQIVDTSGQFNVTSSLPQLYRGAHGAAVVFDVASWDSLVSVRQWVSMVREKCGNEIPIILVANKTDRDRQVDVETAECVRDEFNLFYIEVSAKTGVNIEETFSMLTEQLMQQRDLGTAGASATTVTVHELRSTSSQCYESPARITAKQPAKRKRIAKDPDVITLIAANEESVCGVPVVTTSEKIPRDDDIDDDDDDDIDDSDGDDDGGEDENEDDNRIPSEIKARGLKAKLAFKNALKTGNVKVFRTRIMLIGQDRAGKTSLKKSFIGLPFDPKEQSTDGIDVDPSKFEFEVDQVKNWQRTDGKLDVSQFFNNLARKMAGELEEEEKTMDRQVVLPQALQDQPKETSPKENEENLWKVEGDEELSENIQNGRKDIESGINQATGREKRNEKAQEARVSHHMVSHSEIEYRKPTIPEFKIEPALPPEEFTHLLVQYLEGLNLQNDTTTEKRHMTLDLWDFAGQHMYYACYPTFLSSRAVYMLIYNLSKVLENTAEPCVRQGGVETSLKNINHETNLENLLSWLVSVSTMCSSKPEIDENQMTKKDLEYLRPPVFIVGTHADKPYQDIKEIELKVQKELFGKDVDGHVIRPLFSVDNTQGSSGEGVAALKKRMIEVLEQEPYMGEEVPVRWFNFEKVVQALVAKKIYYLNIEQLQAIIQKVCFIESDIEAATMLDFFHDLGMIVKHRNSVVLQAQWLIDVFKQLITIRSFSDMEPRHSKMWNEMETSGFLSMELVDHAFSKFCQQGAIKEDILNMMEQFGLIAKFAASPADVKYFVPSQLKTPPWQLCKMEPSPSDPCPLYISFLGGFVPHGLFTQLVSRCTRWCSMSGFKQPPTLFDGATRFFIQKKLLHQLFLICKKRFIKIVLKQPQPVQEASLAEINEVASLVLEFLKQTMQNLMHELPWLSNLTYDWCVPCPYCPGAEDTCSKHGQVSCTHEDCLCLLKLLEVGQLSHCEKSFSTETPTVTGLAKWLSIEAVRPGRHPGTDDVYKMTALPRGITLIINNNSFADHPKYGKQLPRLGSEKDVRQVEELFTALGFEVHTKENLTRKEFLDELDSLACSDHNAYDCFVLWLMSHGKSGEVFCSDGVPLPIQTAQDMFSKCDTLKGKPKLFFIQACRGGEEDEGVAITADTSSPIQPTSIHVDSPTDTVNPPVSKVPTHADFLYSFSTVDEHVSYRHEVLGSYYVRALVEAFRERAVYDHLLDILTIVNQKVSNMEANLSSIKNKTDIKIFKQMPEVKHTLRRKVRF